MKDVKKIVQQLKNAVENYDTVSDQWNVDGTWIDCDAEGFWKIIEEKLREVL